MLAQWVFRRGGADGGACDVCVVRVCLVFISHSDTDSTVMEPLANSRLIRSVGSGEGIDCIVFSQICTGVTKAVRSPEVRQAMGTKLPD